MSDTTADRGAREPRGRRGSDGRILLVAGSRGKRRIAVRGPVDRHDVVAEWFDHHRFSVALHVEPSSDPDHFAGPDPTFARTHSVARNHDVEPKDHLLRFPRLVPALPVAPDRRDRATRSRRRQGSLEGLSLQRDQRPGPVRGASEGQADGRVPRQGPHDASVPSGTLRFDFGQRASESDHLRRRCDPATRHEFPYPRPRSATPRGHERGPSAPPERPLAPGVLTASQRPIDLQLFPARRLGGKTRLSRQVAARGLRSRHGDRQGLRGTHPRLIRIRHAGSRYRSSSRRPGRGS